MQFESLLGTYGYGAVRVDTFRMDGDIFGPLMVINVLFFYAMLIVDPDPQKISLLLYPLEKGTVTLQNQKCSCFSASFQG
jgi:hypothetical protein